MAPLDPPNLFVEDYIKLVGTEDGLKGFQKTLEMRGLKKSEQQPLLEAYVLLPRCPAPTPLPRVLAPACGATPSRSSGSAGHFPGPATRCTCLTGCGVCPGA